MAGVVKSISASVAEVTKIAGSSIEIPKELTSLNGVMGKAETDYEAVSNALKVIGQQGAAMEKSAKMVDAALGAALKAVAKDDFGLDAKSPDGKKKLDAIRKVLVRPRNIDPPWMKLVA